MQRIAHQSAKRTRHRSRTTSFTDFGIRCMHKATHIIRRHVHFGENLRLSSAPFGRENTVQQKFRPNYIPRAAIIEIRFLNNLSEC